MSYFLKKLPKHYFSKNYGIRFCDVSDTMYACGRLCLVLLESQKDLAIIQKLKMFTNCNFLKLI